MVTLFDETTRAGGTTFHPSVMVNLVGSPGHYRLQGYSIGPAGKGTVFFDELKDGPVFPTGKWVTVRVDADVKTKQVRVYQDNALASAGPYLDKPGLAGAHMGLYANRKMTRATVFNDNINNLPSAIDNRDCKKTQIEASPPGGATSTFPLEVEFFQRHHHQKTWAAINKLYC